MARTFRSSARSLTYVIFPLVLLVLLSNCGAWARKPKPTPLPTQPAGLVQTLTATAGTTHAAPAVITAVAMAAETAAQETAAAVGLAPSAETALAGTLTACPPPTGWVSHIIRQGETLFYAASSTGTSVEEVMKANCLTSDLLQVGQRLYLPSIPPARATFTPAPVARAQPPAPLSAQSTQPNANLAGVSTSRAPEETASNLSAESPEPQAPEPLPIDCASDFSCISPFLPPFNLIPAMATPPPWLYDPKWLGTPDVPVLPIGPASPCSGDRSEPWIASTLDRLAIGTRVYFFACRFETLPLYATLVKPGNIEASIQLLTESPTFLLPRGNSDAVLTWPALPDQPTGKYTLNIYGTGEQAALQFEVFPATQDAILIEPISGPPGTDFSVYYIFDQGVTRQIALYGQDGKGRDSWSVTVSNPLPNGKVWAMQTLASAETDPTGTYGLTFLQYQFAPPHVFLLFLK